MLRGKGAYCVCKAESKPEPGETGSERGGKGGHVENYRPGLGDGIYSKCDGKQLGNFKQGRNTICLLFYKNHSDCYAEKGFKGGCSGEYSDSSRICRLRGQGR